MADYDERTYSERIAGVYDDWYGSVDQAAIEALSRLARGGRALELGIGTGRVALPLQQVGVEIHGIDASPAMLARLRAKPGGASLPVALGNFADVAVDGQFSLIYVLFNTFFALLTQDEQLRCFANVAQHLTPEGLFVLEAFVPALTRYEAGQALRVVTLGEGRVRLEASTIDVVGQQITTQHVVLSEAGVRLYPVKLRYAWPSELDLMARLAGLQLQERWGGWKGEAFTADSPKHVSVYSRVP